MEAKVPQSVVAELWVYESASSKGVDLFLVTLMGRRYITVQLYHRTEAGEWLKGSQGELYEERLFNENPLRKIRLPEPDQTPYQGESENHILQLIHEDLVEMFMENPDEIRSIYEDKKAE